MNVSRRSFVTGVSIATGSIILGRSRDAFAGDPPAGYRWEVSQKAGIKFAIWKAWTINVDGGVLVTKHHNFATNGIGMEFVAVTRGEAADAEKQMLAQVTRTLVGAKQNAGSTPIAQHGLSGFLLKGTGKNQSGVPKEWFSVVLGDGKGHGMLTLVLGNVGMVEASTEAKTTLNSIALA